MAAKIKDGLFIGDAETSQSEVFINDNKISNLINLAGREVPNIWSSHGLVYLTYNWEDRPDFRLFSGQDDDILTSIVEFVDVSIAHGISVLLFSRRGTGRCVIAACLYLMMKYRWGFEKSYDYVYSKKPDIDLNKGFIQQMFALDMKLLAARQKAYALKHGIENGFRIEPSMTINDIAAMLPPVEAKRWNSWDPNYILAPNLIMNEAAANGGTLPLQPHDEETILWHKHAEAIVNALRKKDSLHSKAMTNKQKLSFRVMDEAEEELVLIFSFLNSKNTISSLPGPYHNAYDIQKSFKLRFDNVLFEEDVNMFPVSPVNPRYAYVPKGILKGVPKRLTSAPSQPNPNNMQPTILFDSSPNNSNQTAGNNSTNNNKRSSDPFGSPADEKLSYRGNSYEYQPQESSPVPAPSKAPIASSAATSSNAAGADDLYKYVGLGGADAKADLNSSRREDKKGLDPGSAHHNNNAHHHDNMWSMEDDRKNNNNGQGGLSAEERLRKLMADMQRQNHFPEHLRPPSHQPGQAKADNSGYDDNYYSTSSISLHDLANMPVQPSSSNNPNAAADLKGNNDSYRRSDSKPVKNHTAEISIIDMERDDLSSSHMKSDPLAAFDIPVPKQSAAPNIPGTSSSSSAAAKGGALRARHDILANSTASRTSAPNPNRSSTSRQAWSSTAAPPPSASNRPPSPSSARPSSPSNARVSSNSSVGSAGSGGGGGGSMVGTGSTTSQKVYRHGSPAPNTRPAFGRSGSNAAPQPSPRTSNNVASSNLSINSTSMSSLGSGLSNLPPGTSNLRSSYSAPQGSSNRPSTSTSTRYASPLAGQQQQSATNRTTPEPQRRGSFGSVASIGSASSNNNPVPSSSAAAAAAAEKRRTMGTSPLRASYAGNPVSNPSSSSSNGLSSSLRPSSTPISSKRFSTPTPQSDQHNQQSSSSAGLTSSRAVRSSTPTKNTWKF